jgi:hypothetical protein
MHAKGVDQTMIDIANATGMPVKLGAKYSAEHQSLGYQQADIRPLEIPKTGSEAVGPFSVSSGARSFTRYGYADFLKAGSRYKVLFRLWPGTQRHLLSADPEMAAAYGRTAHFCGAVGLDLMEPLTFKGREGSGQTGGRCAYADASLNPKTDWEKFELYYRVWGRRLFDPDANPEAWLRWLRSQFGAGAIAVEAAVANASRILPLLTSAHLPSASNHSFWPEMYTNMPMVRGTGFTPYSDTPEPKCFATVSPLDPVLFATIEAHAADEMGLAANPKYSPIEVAQWIEDCATASSAALCGILTTLAHDFFPRLHWVSGPPHGQAPHRRQDDHHQRLEGDRSARQREALLEELSLEDRINEEVRVILDAYSEEMRKSGAQYAEMFKKVKTELAKKYKAVL